MHGLNKSRKPVNALQTHIHRSDGYSVILWFFFLLSLTALFSAVLLWRREAGPKGHGLEAARAG